MGKLKIPDSEMNPEELDVEWSNDKDYVKYEGEIPETGEVVNGVIKKMWWTYSGDNTPMIKVLFEADETAGEYEGLPIWENLTLKPSAAFKYGPFLEFFGLTLKDIKNKTYVIGDDGSADDNNGAPIEKISGFAPGSNEAYCAVAVARSKYNGEWKAEVGEWLEYDPDRYTPEEEPEEEPPPARPSRQAARATSNGAAKTKTQARRAVKEAVEEEPEDEPEEAPKRPAARARASAKPAARTAAAKPAARGRRPARAAVAADDEPPF
jgi:hypothetical protein